MFLLAFLKRGFHEIQYFQNHRCSSLFAGSFLNTFTDLGHKIVIQNTLTKVFAGPELVVYSIIMQAMILLPFILTFTSAGFVGDKFPKNNVMKWVAFTAIPISISILGSYHFGWFEVAFVLTFLLALQSAIYSSAKYGYIKELVGKKNLAVTNSAIQGLTIMAILGGTLVYTILFEHYIQANSTAPAVILKDIQIAGILLVAAIDNTQIINGILAAAAIGVAIGSVFAARVSRSYIEISIIPIGVLGMSACLLLLPFLSNLYAMRLLFIFFGFFGGCFIVSLNSLIQFHVKDNESGHILAANNFIQTLTMISFLGITIFLSQIGISNQHTFLLLEIITLLGSLWTLKTFPQSLLR